MVFDLDVELIDAVEAIARKRRRSFPFMMSRILASGIRLKLREWRGF